MGMRSTSVMRVLVGVAVLALVLTACSAEYIKESILCDDIEAICSTDQVPNDKNSTDCKEKKSFLNPERCNCGAMCIKELEKGDACKVASESRYPGELCGPGLECQGEDDHVCTRNLGMKCIQEAEDYDVAVAEGSVGPGQHQPNCDDYGQYAGTQCSPGTTCYCVDEEGKRLFGEALSFEQHDMDCACSRYWDESKNKGFNKGLRCLPNGNFDPLYCTGDACYCYDHLTQNVTIGPLPIEIITLMACYNASHHSPEYTRPCHQALTLLPTDTGAIVVGGSTLPVCDPDGYYSAVQTTFTEAYCADQNGERIEDFSQDLGAKTAPTCNCARRRAMLTKLEASGSIVNMPKCCPNGDFFPWQTRGAWAFCVDENGNQLGTEVPITGQTALSCYKPYNPCG